MRKLLIAGTAATALAAAFPATGKCLDDLNKARDELSKNEQFKTWNASGRFEADYRRLVSAATIFSENNMEERCQDVVKGIRELATKLSSDAKTGDRATTTPAPTDNKSMAERDKATPGTTPPDKSTTERTPPPSGTTPPDRTTTERRDTTTPVPAPMPRRDTTTTERRDTTTTDRRDTTTTDRRQVLTSAKPMASATVSADALIGADVRNAEDKDLGEVADVELQGGNIQAVIVGRGGFLGLGASHYRIEPAKLRITGDNKIVVLDMTEDQIKAMPKVAKKDGRWVQDGDADKNRDTRTTDPQRRDTTAPANAPPRK